MQKDAPRAQNGARADVYARTDVCADTHPCRAPHAHIAGKVRAWTDVYTVFEDALMVDAGTGIDDDVAADLAARTADRSGAYDGARSKYHVTCDRRAWMDRAEQP